MRRSKTDHLASTSFLIPSEEDLYIRDALSLYNLSDHQLNQVFQGLHEIEMRQKNLGKNKIESRNTVKNRFREKETINNEKKNKQTSKILLFILLLVLIAIIFRARHIFTNNKR